MAPIEFIYDCEGFDWDKGNLEKNWVRHGVSPSECERAFFNQPFVVFEDAAHSDREKRYYALARTDQKRHLFLVFVIRKGRVRVISARDMSRKEREAYRHYEKKDTLF